MKLQKQLQILLKEAPQHGIPKTVMEEAVNPVLMAFAKTLKHPKYYIITNTEGKWLVTTLSHQEGSQPEKTVIYAFATPQDAFDFHHTKQLKIAAIPLTHLLFQLFALKPVDSIIFMAESGNLDRGLEIRRRELEDILEKQLQQLNPNKSIIT